MKKIIRILQITTILSIIMILSSCEAVPLGCTEKIKEFENAEKEVKEEAAISGSISTTTANKYVLKGEEVHKKCLN